MPPQSFPATATAGGTPLDEDEKGGVSKPLASTIIGSGQIAAGSPATSDTASLVASAPGVSLYQAGGVSGLPAIDGLADDRVKVLVNGMDVTSACANHMNPPLSYTDPQMVRRIAVVPGITPVSQGGDSLGGTIVVDTASPVFAAPGAGVVTSGRLSASYRSNGDGASAGGSATAATANTSISYSGAWTRAGNYEDGAGREVGSTLYEAQNHTLTLAARDGGDLYVIEAGMQHIPYQGFVNQPMDMVLNDAWHVNARYESERDWGKLTLGAFEHHTRHSMNFLDDKLRSFEAAGWGANATMPMNTRGDDAGLSITAEVPRSPGDNIRFGSELHFQYLDDWWPAVCDTPFCGMGPLDYHNIDAGMRGRIGTFVEWEHKWDSAWSSLVGLRNDTVWMNTGGVQPYERMAGDIDSDAAAAFNARDHERTDVNFDFSALARYEPESSFSFEAGYARKSRAPNLYERYAWGLSPMTSQMTSWFGDANGYVGNLDLDSEIAHRLSLTLGLHDPARSVFDVKITPYYTHVEDFITAELAAPEGWVNGFNQLMFVNHDAELYGVDISGRAKLGSSEMFGALALSGTAGYVHGEDLEAGEPLYHIMPWNGRLMLEHTLGRWTNVAEFQMVAAKTRVDSLRLEPQTPGYTLLNLRSSYEWENVRIDAGVENVFDKLYYPPLGGTNYTDYLFPGHAVAGAGRSFYTGISVKF